MHTHTCKYTHALIANTAWLTLPVSFGALSNYESPSVLSSQGTGKA